MPSQLNDAASLPHAVIDAGGTGHGAAFELHDVTRPAALLGNPQPRPRTLGTGLRLVDLAALLLAFELLGVAVSTSATIADRLLVGAVAVVVAMAAMQASGLYRSRCCARKGSELWRLTIAASCGGGVVALAQLQSNPEWWQAPACAGAAVAATALGRSGYGRFLRARRSEGRHLRPVLLVGSNADAAALRTTFDSEPELGYTVTGVVTGGETIDFALKDLRAVQAIAGIPRLAAETGANGIFIVPYALASKTVEEAITIASRARLHIQVWPGLRGVGTARLRSAPISGAPVFYIERRTSVPWQITLKRVLDVAGALVALVCAAPILLAAAILIKLNDGGPIFFQGERVGLNGTRIYPLKLRTMAHRHNCHPSTLQHLNERTDGPLFKSSADPRVTRVGRFLRASSIDELPQLWNVLKGTMSLVGPRPCLPTEAAEFDAELQRRFSVRPGMTGLWQVEARHNPSFNAYRRHDLRYVDNWSIGLDLSILAATVPAVVSQAYRSIRRSRRPGWKPEDGQHE